MTSRRGLSRLSIFLLLMAFGLAAPATLQADRQIAVVTRQSDGTVAWNKLSRRQDSDLRLATLPDLAQLSIDPSLPGAGEMYCGPVAAANSLLWLNRFAGMPLGSNLQDTSAEQTPAALVRELGSYMGTDLGDGTPTAAFIAGLDRFMRASGTTTPYQIRQRGWRPVPAAYASEGRPIDYAWLNAQCRGATAVFINVGWYQRIPTPDGLPASYLRLGGHWLTLVSCGVNASGSETANMLVVRDPAGFGESRNANRQVTFRALIGGTLRGGIEGLPAPAHGLWTLEGFDRPLFSFGCAVIDSVVVLRLGS